MIFFCQGGSTSPIQHQQGSLNSSTSSLTSLQSSSGNIFQRASSIETEQMPQARNDSSLSLRQQTSLHNSASSLGPGISFSPIQSPRDQNLQHTSAMQGKAQNPRDPSYQETNQFQGVSPRDQTYRTSNQFQGPSPRDQGSQFAGQMQGQDQMNQGFQVITQATQAQLQLGFQTGFAAQGISPREPSSQASVQLPLQAPREQAFPASSQGQAPPSEVFTQPGPPIPQSIGAAKAPYGDDASQMNLVGNPLQGNKIFAFVCMNFISICCKLRAILDLSIRRKEHDRNSKIYSLPRSGYR